MGKDHRFPCTTTPLLSGSLSCRDWSRQRGGAIRFGLTGRLDRYQSSYGCGDKVHLFDEAAQHAGWVRDNAHDVLRYLPSGSTATGP